MSFHVMFKHASALNMVHCVLYLTTLIKWCRSGSTTVPKYQGFESTVGCSALYKLVSALYHSSSNGKLLNVTSAK